MTKNSGYDQLDTQLMQNSARQVANGIASSETVEEALKALQTKEKHTNLVKWVTDEYNKMKNAMDPLKRQWHLNMAFYKGDQYMDIVNDRLIKLPASERRVRLTINRIKPVVRTELARMTTQDPTAEVVPATSETKDVLAAKAAEQVFLSTRERLKLKKLILQACWWTSVCGTGYIKTTWNKEKIETYPDGQVAQGDLTYTALSPFHVLVPDLLEPEIQEQGYVFNVFTKPIDWVKAKWNNILPDDIKPSVVSSTEIMDESRLNIRGSSQQGKPDSCLIIEAWIKPGACKLLPKGGLVTVVDKYIVALAEEGLPYAHGDFPFAKFESVPTGSYYAASVIEDLIQPQRELNRIRSQKAEARNKMGNPGIAYYKGSLDPNKYTNGIGQLVEIMPGMAMPTNLPVPQIPNFVAEEQEEILRDVEDISGQHQVSKGNTPSGVTAATAIQFLQEQDNSYMSTVFDSIEEAVKVIASHTIQLFIQFVDSKRMIKIVGRDGAISTEWLTGSDIRTGTDIRVEGGSSLPTSKAARIAMIMDLMTKGMIPPEMGLELMGLPNWEAYWDVTKVDQRQAERENVRLSQLPVEDVQAERQAREEQKQQTLMEVAVSMGANPEEIDLDSLATLDPQFAQLAAQFDGPIMKVNDFDNHEVHIEIHNRFRKSQDYETLDESLQEEFDRHVAKHEEMLQQKAMEQMFFANGGMPDPEDPETQQGDSGQEEGQPNQFSGIPGSDDEQVESQEPVA